MNSIEKGKKQLSNLGILIIVVSIILGALGIVGVVIGCIKSSIPLFVCGLVAILVTIGFICYGIIFVWTSKALVATKGNIAEDNSLATNSVNQVKCQKCGMPLDENGNCPNHPNQD